MRSTPKLRQPRTRFAMKAKPRSTRGISRKEGHKQLSLGYAATGKRHRKASRRVNRLPEWTDKRSYITKGGRHRLHGDDYGLLRRRAFNRAHGHCECGCGRIAPLCTPFEGRPWEGTLSHKKHGARKSDELNEVLWFRHECHMK